MKKSWVMFNPLAGRIILKEILSFQYVDQVFFRNEEEQILIDRIQRKQLFIGKIIKGKWNILLNLYR